MRTTPVLNNQPLATTPPPSAVHKLCIGKAEFDRVKIGVCQPEHYQCVQGKIVKRMCQGE